MNVLVCGVGHLGSYLVQSAGYDIHFSGTYFSTKKEYSFDQYQLDVNSENLNHYDFFNKKWNTIIWLIPPKENYLRLLKYANESCSDDIPWIFISSTSVYLEGDVTENTKRKPSRRNGKLLIEIENKLKGLKRKVTLLRPSGLVDSHRNPNRFFIEKPVPAYNSFANLVHTEDVARFIQFIIKTDKFGEDFNLSSSVIHEKSFFYQSLNSSIKLGQKTEYVKKILNNKSIEVGFKYKYPDLLKYFTDLP